MKTPFIILIAFVPFILLLLLLVLLLKQRKSEPASNTRTNASPVGKGMAIGIAIGMGTGVALGVAMDNIGLGIALGAGTGVSIGVAMGAAFKKQEEEKRLNINPKFKREQTISKAPLILGLIAVLLGILILGLIFFGSTTIFVGTYIKLILWV